MNPKCWACRVRSLCINPALLENREGYRLVRDLDQALTLERGFCELGKTFLFDWSAKGNGAKLSVVVAQHRGAALVCSLGGSEWTRWENVSLVRCCCTKPTFSRNAVGSPIHGHFKYMDWKSHSGHHLFFATAPFLLEGWSRWSSDILSDPYFADQCFQFHWNLPQRVGLC